MFVNWIELLLQLAVNRERFLEGGMVVPVIPKKLKIALAGTLDWSELATTFCNCEYALGASPFWMWRNV